MRSAEWLAFGVAALVGLYLIAAAGWPIAVARRRLDRRRAGPTPAGPGRSATTASATSACSSSSASPRSPAPPTCRPARSSALALLAALPVGALATAILVVNNARDADERSPGRQAHAGGPPRHAPRRASSTRCCSAAPTPSRCCCGRAASPRRAVLLPLLTLPLAARRIADMARADDGAAFNALLGGTARLQLLFGALFAAGLLR